ncbi:MAG: hypothetical protein Q7T76_20150 [Ferruginibacter sp.]|nr:hypothetical protein [Ferruginibacter sp.]
MKLKKLPTFLTVVALGMSNLVSAQLVIDNATFFVEAGATVTVQGDLTSNANIQGPGKILLKGTSNQNINMGGFSIPNLEMDNASNVTLTGNLKIGTALMFTNGKILLGDNNLTFSELATTSGQGASKFVETNGNGQLVKLLTADVAAVELPLGTGTNYRPAFVSSTGTYSNASVGVKALAVPDPNRPPMISDYVATYWPVTKSGVTGTVTVAGQYVTADITGTESNLRGYFYNGTDWTSASETHDAGLNRVSAPISAATGSVYAMDKFVLTKAKVFLQGAYNSVTGVMSDALRTPSNLIPLTDPYRAAPYNFVQVANPVAESAAVSVFGDQANANDNIVDWVFLELRNNGTNPGSNILQTRSALVKRDGSIVDVDGISPVTFNNVVDGNYTVAVRHRNHLGISADPTTNLLALAEKKSTASLLDLTTATDAQIFGTTAAYTTAGGKNMLWAGNANFNNNAKYTGPANDKDYLLGTVLGGLGTATVAGYSAGDLNFNRSAKYTGPANDKDFLLANILSGISTATRTQALPQ